MGILDIFRRNRSAPEGRDLNNQPIKNTAGKTVVGAENKEDGMDRRAPFYNSNITYSGNLASFNYASILRDKQSNIVQLYQLADYYSDADPIVRGIIRHVYLPYTISSPWVLSGNQKTCKIYEAEYQAMRLREKLESIAFEFWKYSNVFVYIMDGYPITLPPHKCKIGGVSINGDPIVDFDCTSVYNEWRAKGYTVKENWIKDNNIQEYFKSFPKEIREGMNKGIQYVQLNPKYCKVLQGPKEDWQRYSVPFIAACLAPLSKKELISTWETSELNLAIRSFVHVRYGDTTKGNEILPDGEQISAVRNVFSQAMSNFPLATTNHLAKAEVIQPKMDDLFQWDKYGGVNNDILSAGGISGILVNGVSEDGSTFASAQISMQTAAARINAARAEICDLMNKINECIKESLAEKRKYNIKTAPTFSFMPLDMSGEKALQEACIQLWQSGVLSTRTMMDTMGYSLDMEKEIREKEAADGTDQVLLPRNANKQNANNNDGTSEQQTGRPEMTDDERHSDPENAIRSKQPKPSSPEGSQDDTSIG